MAGHHPAASSACRLEQPGSRLFGLELEMIPVHQASGTSMPVRHYFRALHAIKRRHGCAPRSERLAGRCVGLHTAVAECGLDNGFNLLETALAPVRSDQGGLHELARRAHAELADALQALQADQACILSASQHPDCARDAQWYAQVCVPRAIYRELRDYRGWHHAEGIDAKAQNGANTSVPVARAVDALNVNIAFAAVGLALFANSPLESGRITGLKETRTLLWPRALAAARFPGDRKLCTRPARPFRDLADFFGWMFGPGTVSRGLPVHPSTDYKGVQTLLLDGNPCLMTVLWAGRWRGRSLDGQTALDLEIGAHHFEYSQIGQFLDARLRYRFQTLPSLPDLRAAWRAPGGLEALFTACGAHMYIEGRIPGAGFADACLLEEAGAGVARSMLMAPMAVQAGLLANLDQAVALMHDWGWQRLGALRQAALMSGLEDGQVRALCADVLAVARAGLDPADRSWLAYADFVMHTQHNAADRLLETWRAASGDRSRKLAAVVARHAALDPVQYGA